jgi:hypothetical protein
MKLKILALACVLSTSAFNEEIANVCTDPIAKVCTSTVKARLAKQARIRLLKEEISKEASLNAAPKIAKMKSEVPVFRLIRRATREIKIYNKEVMASAKKRIGGLETIVTSPAYVNLLKSNLKQAIDESKFDSITKSNFKNTIDSIVIGNFSEFLDRANLEDDPKLREILSNPCGSNGLVQNAFATELLNENTKEKEKYVLICPGFLLTLAEESSDEERLNSIIHVISHEMGHHIDNSSVGNQYYARYLACVANGYVDAFGKSKEDEKFCKKNDKNPIACTGKVILSHSGEIIADAWGIKATAVHARNKGYSFEQTSDLITSSWNNLCTRRELRGKELEQELKEDGIHPLGDFRIGTLLRMDTGLTEYLGCGADVLNGKPICNF